MYRVIEYVYEDDKDIMPTARHGKQAALSLNRYEGSRYKRLNVNVVAQL